MEILTTTFKDLLEIRGNKYSDERGWFREFHSPRTLKRIYPEFPDFVQDNLSFSKKGVIRGLHLQLAPHAQAKLVSVIQGKVLDVAVDLRPGSATHGQSYQILLSGEEQNSMLIPEGFAHGFAALEDTLFLYKCSAYYEPKAETGIRWNDADLKIQWPFENPIVSSKDQQLQTLAELQGKLLISPHA